MLFWKFGLKDEFWLIYKSYQLLKVKISLIIWVEDLGKILKERIIERISKNLDPLKDLSKSEFELALCQYKTPISDLHTYFEMSDEVDSLAIRIHVIFMR